VVDDQIRTPTYVEDLVAGLLLLLEKRALGVYNLCGEEILTPFEMAVKTAKYLGLNHELLIRASSASLQQLAQRPLVTGLKIDKAKEELGFMPRSFEQGLMDTFRPH
jgi:dTDP-4-dehydrorhamnose reductase